MAPCFAKRSLLEIIRKPKPKRFGKSFCCQSSGVYLPPVGPQECRRRPRILGSRRTAASQDSVTRYLGTWQHAEDAMKQLIKFKSPLHEMTQTTPTCFWNDSASLQELSYSIEHGAVGATCNPVIVLGVLKKEIAAWKDRLNALVQATPPCTEGR